MLQIQTFLLDVGFVAFFKAAWTLGSKRMRETFLQIRWNPNRCQCCLDGLPSFTIRTRPAII